MHAIPRQVFLGPIAARTARAAVASLVIVASLSCASAEKREGFAAGVYTGRAEGGSLIYRNDVKRARENAIAAALERLVEKAKAATPPPAGPAAADAFVLGRNARIVKNMRIIDEGVKGAHFVATVEGEVHPASAYGEVRALIRNYRIPRVMIFVGEEIEGARSRPGLTLTELAIGGTLVSLGFDVLDLGAAQVRAPERIGDDLQSAPGGSSAAKKLRAMGVGLVIVGMAKTVDQSKAMSQFKVAMRSKQAIIGLKAIDLATGAVMASVSVNAPGNGLDDTVASRNAVENCVARALGRFNLREERFQPGAFMRQLILSYARMSERTLTQR